MSRNTLRLHYWLTSRSYYQLLRLHNNLLQVALPTYFKATLLRYHRFALITHFKVIETISLTFTVLTYSIVASLSYLKIILQTYLHAHYFLGNWHMLARVGDHFRVWFEIECGSPEKMLCICVMCNTQWLWLYCTFSIDGATQCPCFCTKSRV